MATADRHRFIPTFSVVFPCVLKVVNNTYQSFAGGWFAFICCVCAVTSLRWRGFPPMGVSKSYAPPPPPPPPPPPRLQQVVWSWFFKSLFKVKTIIVVANLCESAAIFDQIQCSGCPFPTLVSNAAQGNTQVIGATSGRSARVATRLEDRSRPAVSIITRDCHPQPRIKLTGGYARGQPWHNRRCRCISQLQLSSNVSKTQ